MSVLDRRSPERNILVWSLFFLFLGTFVTWASIRMIMSPDSTFLKRIAILFFSVFVIGVLLFGLKSIVSSELERKKKIQKVLSEIGYK
ncbi:MAG: hypothetical protein R6V01_07180 [Thermoplasmatota archaeon]